ncbi:MAG: hypothetical protein KAX38_06645, partial [Candidatus Krumholzibacteria bacterium]|nr:hypothetical protein [Candidatus Krumholzibacteria bacterium]
IKGFSDEFLEFLKSYSFPDNVQELRTIVAGAVAGTETGFITIDSLPLYIRDRIEPEKAALAEAFLPRRLDDVIKEHVMRTLEHFGQDREAAVKRLGISLEEIERIAGKE